MLEIEHVGGGYDAATVLHDVSISVPSGSVVALLGPNGAGKSTTLKMVSGLLRPDSGRVVLDGDEVTRLGAHERARRGICHVMEGRGIFPSLTVKENLLLQSRRGMSSSEILDRTNDGFPRLTERLQQQAGTLSGGEQQMVALMRAHLSSPQVVLVDEASLGLAPIIVDQIFDFLTRLARDGVSLLIVEQYVTRALDVASIVYVLSRGHVVHSRPARDLDEDSIFSLYAQQPEPRTA